jgi:hypothetical protein
MHREGTQSPLGCRCSPYTAAVSRHHHDNQRRCRRSYLRGERTVAFCLPLTETGTQWRETVSIVLDEEMIETRNFPIMTLSSYQC